MPDYNLYLSCRLCDYPPMTTLRARFILFAILAIFLATAGNALFLQDRSRMLRASRFPIQAPAPAAVLPLPSGAVPGPGATAYQPALDPKESRLQAALHRELARLGYADQLQAPRNGLRLAVLAYEFDNGLPLTGEPADGLLKRILFDPNQAPRGIFADRAEANQRLVMEVQRVLLGLGFLRGSVTGRMDAWTADAVKDFERHRRLPPEGRLTEVTILELISYSGQPQQLSPG